MASVYHPRSLMCQQSQAFQSFLLAGLVACLCLKITSKAGIKCNNVLVHVCAFVLQCSCACALVHGICVTSARLKITNQPL